MYTKAITWKKSFVMLILFQLFLFSCTVEHIDETSQVENKSASTQAFFSLPPETNSLTVYTMSMTSFTLHPAINLFQTSYPNVSVEEVTIGDGEYGTRLSTELAAGMGPDLVFSFGTDIPDIYKTASTGIFCNLESFFEADSDFSMEDFVEGVMDGGVIDGKRYLVPIEYGVPMLTTTQSILNEAGVTEEDLSTFDRFLDTILRYHDTFPERTIFIDLGIDQNRADMRYFLRYSGIVPINYTEKKVAVNVPAFKKMMDTLKRLYIPGQQETGVSGEAGKRIMGGALSEKSCLFNNYFSTADSVFFYERAILKSAGEEPLYFLLPDANGGVTAEIQSFAAIPQGSDNQLNAYRLLKILLSDEIQGGYDNSELKYLRLGNPVRKSALRTKLDKESWGTLDDDTIENYIKMLTSIDRAVMLPDILYDYVTDEMLPYVNGSKEWDKCLARLENTLNLYKDE